MKTTIFLDNLKDLNLGKGGLSDSEVVSQRLKYGKNEFMAESGTRWWNILGRAVKDPMVLLLFVAGSIFLAVGNLHEAITLYLAIAPLLFMDIYLHYRTDLSTRVLKENINRIVFVRRGNNTIQIDYTELVPGDLILLKTGDLISADGFLEESADLLIDESLLTGESLPINKMFLDVDLSEHDREYALDRAFLAFAGTRVVRGMGTLRIFATGVRTEYGMIVQSLSKIPKERTALQKNISDLVRILTMGGLAGCVCLAVIRVVYGDSLASALLSAAILAVAAMPEEFPIVFSFYLGIGVYRLAKRNALVRRAVTVESIGSVKCICTDKTGTMTIGDLTLCEVDFSANSSKEELLQAAFYASDPQPVDPVDIAISNIYKEALPFQRNNTFPFTEHRKKESVIGRVYQGSKMCFSKGAPETILSLCDLSPNEIDHWRHRISEYSSRGNKIIACAQKQLGDHENDKNEPRGGFSFLGILGFSDLIRPGVNEAISYCRENRIKVIMLTGDHPGTAKAIAAQAGMGNGFPKVLSVGELDDFANPDQVMGKTSVILSHDVIARCNPLQKLWIVQALKKEFEVVAVTGDGVNDVPALQQADIGIAMGRRGTRAAREIASIILTDDNFSSIINAVREGKQLFRNLNYSFEYLLIMQIPLVLGALVIPLMGYPLLFLPIHLVWFELVIHPTSLLGFQMPVSSESTKYQDVSFFKKQSIIRASLNGLMICFFMIINFILALNENKGIEHARGNALLVIFLAGIVHHGLKTKISTRSAAGVFCMNLIGVALLFELPSLTKLVSVASMDVMDWGRGLLLVLISTILSMFLVKHS